MNNITVNIKYKPKDSTLSTNIETKKVTLVLEERKSRSKYYKLAEQKCIRENIIDKYGMKYWEPYDLQIYCKPPSNKDKPVSIIN